MSGASVVQPGWCPGCDPSNCEGCGPTPRLLSKELEAMGPAAMPGGGWLTAPAPVAHGNHADLLREAAELFRFYEQSHRARGPEHLAKAERNAEIAGRIETALVAPAPVAPSVRCAPERDPEDELNCAEEVLDALAVDLDLPETMFDCIGDYITAVVTAIRAAPAPVVQPLTDAQLDALRQGESRLNFVTLREFRAIARAIEHALGVTGEQK